MGMKIYFAEIIRFVNNVERKNSRTVIQKNACENKII